MKRCNCLVFVLMKLRREGGYVEIRPSRSFRFIPHFLHLSKDRRILSHWQPLTPYHDWRVVLHKIWFKGEVKHED